MHFGFIYKRLYSSCIQFVKLDTLPIIITFPRPLIIDKSVEIGGQIYNTGWKNVIYKSRKKIMKV